MGNNIKELREKLQKKNEIYYIRFARVFSIYFTKVFLMTPITANQVTLIGILITITGSGLLMTNLPVIGVFLLFLGLVFDCIDGEIARYRKTISLKGAFIDDFSYFLIETLPFAALTIYALRFNYILVLFGVLALFSLMMSRVMIERRHFLEAKWKLS